MRKVVLFIVMVGLVTPALSQHLIGLTKNEVVNEIKTGYPNFFIDNTSVNHAYKYLKYVDRNNEQTLLVFLSENDICTSTKRMVDYLYLDGMKKDLNKRYHKAGTNKWTYSKGNIAYQITLKREEWFFTLFTSKK